MRILIVELKGYFFELNGQFLKYIFSVISIFLSNIIMLIIFNNN